MALNIPLPSADFGGQLASGSQNLLNQLMTDKRAREQLAQQMQIHKDSLGIQQQQQARLQQQWEQQQAENAYLQNLLNGGQAGSAPTQQFGEGMGMFTPEGLQERQQQQPQGQNWDALRNSPYGRMLAKKRYGFDPAAETPDQKEARDVRTATSKEEAKLTAKEKKTLESELPIAREQIESLDRAIRLAKENPEFFGPGILGMDLLGPSYRKRNVSGRQKREAYGEIETILGSLVGPQAQEFSTRGLKVALDLARELKPGFGEHHEISIGKLMRIRNKLQKAVGRMSGAYGEVGGTRPRVIEAGQTNPDPLGLR